MQKLINKSIKLSEDELHYLDVLKFKYHIKINQFIRKAIVEKVKRDIPGIRIEFKNKKLPF